MEQSSPPVLEDRSTGEGAFGIVERVRGAVEVCSVAAGDRGVDEWMGLLGEVSQAQAVLAAARDAAIVRLAAVEEVVTEDGVVGEQVNGLGTVCLDRGDGVDGDGDLGAVRPGAGGAGGHAGGAGAGAA